MLHATIVCWVARVRWWSGNLAWVSNDVIIKVEHGRVICMIQKGLKVWCVQQLGSFNYKQYAFASKQVHLVRNMCKMLEWQLIMCGLHLAFRLQSMCICFLTHAFSCSSRFEIKHLVEKSWGKPQIRFDLWSMRLSIYSISCNLQKLDALLADVPWYVDDWFSCMEQSAKTWRIANRHTSICGWSILMVQSAKTWCNANRLYLDMWMIDSHAWWVRIHLKAR
jgi:hypothetical protein